MRIALLSALADLPGKVGASTTSSAGERPAFRRFAGKSVLSHQIDCAAHLGCTRVLCLASGIGPDLGAAKSYAERAGLRFEVVDSIPRLAGQVTADDDIILLADGILPDRAAMVDALAQCSGVLAFPAQPAIELGFERLDATRAWSGALRTRGDNVARLADLPPDCDLGSSLLRIALQAGVRVTELDPAALADDSWQRRVDRSAVSATEWRWITRQVNPAPFAAPLRALVERIGLRWAHDAAGGRWARAPHVSALVAAMMALVGALAGWPVAGLGALLAASGAMAIAGIFDRVEALGARPRPAGPVMAIAGWLRDGLLVALLAMLAMTVPAWLGLVLALLFVGLLRLGEASMGPRLAALFGDRILLLAAFLPIAYVGWTVDALSALSLLALALMLWTTRYAPTQLTPD